MSKQKIPQTDSIKELAKFWDTHDLTDFEDELEEVSEPVFEQKQGKVMTIRLRTEEAEAIKNIAKSKGLEESALVREWVVEKIRGH